MRVRPADVAGLVLGVFALLVPDGARASSQKPHLFGAVSAGRRVTSARCGRKCSEVRGGGMGAAPRCTQIARGGSLTYDTSSGCLYSCLRVCECGILLKLVSSR